jgi:DNA-binding NarL/FixJ family response regulator
VIRVALAEDSLLVREGLLQLLSAASDVEVVAACEDPDALLAAVAEYDADVVVTDIRMPPTRTDEGIRVAAELRERNPEVGVVVLSQYDDPAYALRLFEKGSDGRGYLLKERVHDRSQLAAAIRSVAEGSSVIDPKIVDVLVAAKAGAERSPLAELTPREHEVLAAARTNATVAEIARAVFLSSGTVRNYLSSAMQKLGAPTRADAVRIAEEKGWL